jgi:rhodanese-related sulfurtransferase
MRITPTLLALSPLLAASLFAAPGCGETPPHEHAHTTSAAACDPDGAPLKVDRSPGGAPEVSPQALAARPCAVTVIDVREDDEVAEGSVPGARWAPLGELESQARGLDPTAPVVLVCRSGRRSAAGVARLQALGFRDVASLTGGLLAWDAVGLPRAPIPEAPRPALTSKKSAADLEDRLRTDLTDPDAFVWMKAAALVMEGAESCVDGRGAGAVLGTPGGDAGELVLVLATAEAAVGRPLTDDEVAALLNDYLQDFGRVYMHTDQHALERLAESLEADPSLHGLLPAPLDVEALVHHPHPGLEDALLARLVLPAHIGCGHLRLMVQDPAQYGLRPGLVEAMLRAWYQRLWIGGGELSLEVLGGHHEEQAVVIVDQPGDVHAFTRVPALTPSDRGVQVFVVHPAVTRYLRRLHVEFLSDHVPGLGDPEQAFETLQALAAKGQAATLTALAPELPKLTLTVEAAPTPTAPGRLSLAAP